MLQHILVGLDGSPLAESILTYVQILAKGLGADVTLLHVVHLPEYAQGGQASDTLHDLITQAKEHAQAYLDEIRDRLQAANIPCSASVIEGDAAGEIVRYAEQEGKDLIALATHGRSGMERRLHGSVADRVLHSTTVPLLLINPTTEWVAAPPGVREVVVALDGSPLAEAVLPLAQQLALSLKVPITLLRVVEMLNIDMYDPVGGQSLYGYESMLGAVRAAAESYLDEVAARLRVNGPGVQTQAPLGFPAADIVNYIHDHPGSMLLMSTHGRTGVVGFFLGSVARRVVQHADVPILVVRPLPAQDVSRPSQLDSQN